MPLKYYINRNDKVRGPFSEERIRELHAEGKLRDTDLVSTRDDGGWKPAKVVLKSRQSQPAAGGRAVRREARPSRGRRTILLAGGSIIVALLVVGGWFYFSGTDRAGSETAMTSSASSPVNREPSPRPDIVFQDFEADSFGEWSVQGTAFGKRPHDPESHPGSISPLMTPLNGRHVADSQFGDHRIESHELTGTLSSPAFTIERNYINFFIAGGEQDTTYVVLKVDGQIERKSGETERSSILRPIAWNVSEFIGKKATIEVIDQSTEHGRICVDSFVFSDSDLTSANLERIARSVQDDSIERNGRKFYFAKQPVPFQQATEFAEQVGGRLLCTVSPEEISFVTQHISSSVWMGITNSNAQNWIGADGHNWSHGPWRYGAPGNFQSRFAVLNTSGKWEDASHTLANYVIEFGPFASSPKPTITNAASNRKAAELIQKKASAVGVATAAGFAWLTATTPLPKEDFELRDVRFSKCMEFSAEEQDVFRETTGITRLSLENCDDSVLEILRYCPNIRSIGIHGGEYKLTALTYLKPGHALTAFGLGSVKTDIKGTSPIFAGAGLVDFHLVGMAASPELGDWLLQQKKSLRTLELNAVWGIGTDGINKLGQLENLESAILWATGTSDENLAAIGRLVNLKSIQLGANHRITGKALADLAPMAKLENLSLWGTALNDAGLANLPLLPSLRGIAIGESKIGDASLGTLSQLPNLREVSINATNVSDAGLQKLASQPLIVKVDAGGTKVTREAMVELAKGRIGFRSDLLLPNSAVAGDPKSNAAASPKSPATNLPTVGTIPPAIEASEWMNSNAPVTLELLRGKTVLVEFWATWCGPCVAGIPHLNEMQKKYGEKGLRILSLTAEDRETVEAFQKTRDEPIEYTVGLGSQSSKAYGVRGIPAAFLIGTDGKLLWTGHPSSSQCEKAIARALGAPMPISLAKDERATVKPGKLKDVGKTLESASKDKAIYDALLKKIERSKVEVASHKRGHVIVGRVQTPGNDDPETVRSQMIIESRGFFADAVGDLNRPIGFRQPGYRPFDLVIPESAVPDSGGVIDVGTLMMEPAPESELRRATGQITLEGGGSPEKANVMFHLSSGPVNTPNNGTEGSRKSRPSPKATIDSSGHIIAVGLSEGDYWVTYNLPGYVEASAGYVRVGAQQDITLKPVELEKPRQILLEFIVASNSTVGFDASQIRKEKVPGGRRWKAGIEPSQYGWDLEFKQIRRNVVFDYTYAPCTMADLGEGKLSDFINPSTEVKQKDPRSVPLKSGHV